MTTKRVQFNNIVQNQLPGYVKSDYPLVAEFLKSYYQGQEYEDLYMVFSGKWIFIRFNPDKYTNKKGVRKNPTIARRLFKLKEEIEKQIKRIQNEENKELVEISYLYYDRFD